MTNSTVTDIRRIPELKCTWNRSCSVQGEYYALHFDAVSEIPRDHWNSILRDDNAFLDLDYLDALEKGHDNGLEVRYVMFTDAEKRFIGIAGFQITHFTTSESAYQNEFLKWINKATTFIRRGHIHNILICGNAIAPGEHGFLFRSEISDDEKIRLIVDAMGFIAQQEKARSRRICAMMVKDFYPNSESLAKALSRRSFTSFQVDHNMVMPVDPEWKTMNDYLAALNTKFRTKAKSAFKRSERLELREMNADDIHTYSTPMQKLYEDVHERADFRLGKMNITSVADMLEKLKDVFFAYGFFLNGRLVGFYTAMKNAESIEAHVIGIDYELNKEHGIYQRMLYEYINLAIRTRCRRIVYGRTAAEIKSSIGAMPVDLTCCIFHPRRISNALLTLILNYVKPSEYPHRNPWRAEVYEQVKAASLY